MKVIGVLGKAGHGKDTVSRLICDELQSTGNLAIKMAFADPLKVMLYAEDPSLDFETLWDTKPAPVRRLLQVRGTEQGRDVFGQNMWIRAVEAQLTVLRRELPIDTVVFSDIRFENEATFALSFPSKVIRVVSDRDTIANYADHRSENSISPEFLASIDILEIQNPLGTSKEELLLQLAPLLSWAKAF
jgi:hypothetical protein